MSILHRSFKRIRFKRHVFCFFLTLLLMLAFTQFGYAQQTLPTPQPKKDTGQIIHLLNADILLGIQGKDGDSSQTQKLIGHVKLRQGHTVFTADSAIRYMKINALDAFGHIHINQADSIHVYADELHYEGNTKIATLKHNVKMTDGQMVLTTNHLNYSLKNRVGTYYKGGKIVNEKTDLTSKKGYYYADTKDVYFKRNVKLNNPEYKLTTDTLLYNTISHIATFLAPTAINTGKTIIFTSCGYYNTDQQFSFLCDRPIIRDSSGTLTADSLRFSKEEGVGKAYGDIIWQDTSGQITVRSDFALSNNQRKTLLATQKPLLILAQESDSLFVTSDTLFTSPVIPIVTPEDSLQKDSIPFVYLPSKDSLDMVYADSLNTLSSKRDSIKSAKKITNLKMKLPVIQIPHYKIDTIKPPLLLPKGSDIAQKMALKKKKDSIQAAKQRKKLAAQKKKLALQQQKRQDSIAAALQKYKDLQKNLPKIKLQYGLEKILIPIYNPADTAQLYRTEVVASDTTQKLSSLSKDSLDMRSKKPNTIDSSDARQLIAYHHVKLYSDSLQGIADSLYYSNLDSSFRFYGDPVMWTGQTQLTGDTITLITKNKKPYKLILQHHAMIVNKVGPDQYNQIKGRRITGYFNDSSQLKQMYVEGNAESIYYALEDSTNAVIGINQTQSSYIRLIFDNSALKKVKFYENITGSFKNPAHLKKEDTKLKGFRWESEKRPPQKPKMLRIKKQIIKKDDKKTFQTPFQTEGKKL